MQLDQREDIAWLNEVLQYIQHNILDWSEDNVSTAQQDVEFIEAFCREVYRRVAPQFEYQGEIVLFSPYEGLQPREGELPCPARQFNPSVVVGIFDRLCEAWPATQAEALLRSRFFPSTQKLNIRIDRIKSYFKSKMVTIPKFDFDVRPIEFNQDLLCPLQDSVRLRFDHDRAMALMHEKIRQVMAPIIEQLHEQVHQIDPMAILLAARDAIVRQFGFSPDFIDYVLPILRLLYDAKGHYPDFCSWNIAYNDVLDSEHVHTMKKLLHTCGQSRARAFHLRSWLMAHFAQNPQAERSPLEQFSPGEQALSELLLQYAEAFASELAPSLFALSARVLEQNSLLPELGTLPEPIRDALAFEYGEPHHEFGSFSEALRRVVDVNWEGMDQQQRVQIWLSALNNLVERLKNIQATIDEMVNDGPVHGGAATPKN